MHIPKSSSSSSASFQINSRANIFVDACASIESFALFLLDHWLPLTHVRLNPKSSFSNRYFGNIVALCSCVCPSTNRYTQRAPQTSRARALIFVCVCVFCRCRRQCIWFKYTIFLFCAVDVIFLSPVILCLYLLSSLASTVEIYRHNVSAFVKTNRARFTYRFANICAFV